MGGGGVSEYHLPAQVLMLIETRSLACFFFSSSSFFLSFFFFFLFFFFFYIIDVTALLTGTNYRKKKKWRKPQYMETPPQAQAEGKPTRQKTNKQTNKKCRKARLGIELVLRHRRQALCPLLSFHPHPPPPLRLFFRSLLFRHGARPHAALLFSHLSPVQTAVVAEWLNVHLQSGRYESRSLFSHLSPVQTAVVAEWLNVHLQSGRYESRSLFSHLSPVQTAVVAEWLNVHLQSGRYESRSLFSYLSPVSNRRGSRVVKRPPPEREIRESLPVFPSVSRFKPPW